MKHSAQILLLAVCASIPASSTPRADIRIPLEATTFVIDASKPYVYLEIDHVGPRKPIREGEPNVGIYLHLTNNCALPLVIVKFGSSLADPKAAITIQDEVVPNPQGPGGDVTGGSVYVEGGVTDLKEMDDIFRSPNLNEAAVSGAEWAQKQAVQGIPQKDRPERPHGYNGGNGPTGVQVITLIPPGGKVFFSVPANHVGATWHFEIPFRLALPNKSRIRPPYSYLAFYQEDLDRAQGKAPAPTTR